MKQITIRECAFRACERAIAGKQVLYEIIREAFTDERPDWDDHESFEFYASTDTQAIYESIAPDIFDSVREEASTKQIVEDICQAFGGTLCSDQGDSHWDNGE